MTTLMSSLKVVPRVTTKAGLKAARLPLTVAEIVARQRGNPQWAPTLGFETVEATVESLVGSLLRDETLLTSAQVRQTKIDQLRKAGHLEAVAEQKRAEADDAFAARRQAAEEKRAEAARRAKQREEDLERNAEEHKRKVQQRAAKKTAAARRAKAKQDEALDREERQAKAAALAAEAESLLASREALSAEDTVDTLDDAIEEQKEARTSG